MMRLNSELLVDALMLAHIDFRIDYLEGKIKVSFVANDHKYRYEEDKNILFDTDIHEMLTNFGTENYYEHITDFRYNGCVEVYCDDKLELQIKE